MPHVFVLKLFLDQHLGCHFCRDGEIQEFRKKAEEELKKTPAYSTLQENITTLQKAVNAMKQGSAEREKKQKQLQELQGQRNRMVRDRQWEYPGATKLGKDLYGSGQDLNQLRNSILETSEWKEADRKYKELEKNCVSIN